MNTLNNTHNNIPQRLRPYSEQILILIYKFRFLTRPQIQILLNQKYHHNVAIWLTNLANEKYLKRYYNPTFAGEPAVYSLGTNARKYFIAHKDIIEDITISLLDRVWRESTYSSAFKKHCVFLGDMYLSLRSLVQTIDSGQGKLQFFSKTDLEGVEHMLHPYPDAYFSIEDKHKNIQRYFLEIIDDHTRWGDIKARVRQYFKYYEKDIWQDNMECDFPEIIIICPDRYYQRSLNKFIQKSSQTRDNGILFYLATVDEVQQYGISQKVLHKVITNDT